MEINYETNEPIFEQVARILGDAILSGAIKEETQIPSITELSVSYKINPATALKGVNILVDDGVVYKLRGIGMFVSSGAVETLKEIRGRTFFARYVSKLCQEAKKLNLTTEQVVEIVKGGMGK